MVLPTTYVLYDLLEDTVFKEYFSFNNLVLRRYFNEIILNMNKVTHKDIHCSVICSGKNVAVVTQTLEYRLDEIRCVIKKE